MKFVVRVEFEYKVKFDNIICFEIFYNFFWSYDFVTMTSHHNFLII